MLWVVARHRRASSCWWRSCSSLLYNRLVRLRNRAENAWAQVDVQLRRRYDLIPNLVETVKGYASHERDDVRGGHKGADGCAARADGAEQAKAENILTRRSGDSSRWRRSTRELRATENFQQLQGQLEETEDKIAVSRQVYNDAVLTYDTALETVPTNIVAGMFSFEAARVLRARGAGRAGGAAGAVLRGAASSQPPSCRAALAAAGERGRQVASRSPRRASPVAVEPDGSLSVEEHITFAFDGVFTGAYRDIPLREGESIQDVFVAEGDARYSPGASAELGSSGSPGHVRDGATSTAGCGSCGTTRASWRLRTFTVGYRLRGRRRLRRRRRRQPEGLGRRVGEPSGG